MSLLREAVSKLGRHYTVEHEINKAFETVGCSCHPLRQERERLDAECLRLEAELHKSAVFKQRDALHEEILAIDRREHPDLDAQGRMAYPFFRVWLFERITGEDMPDLSSPGKLAASFAEAWLGGWRPKGG
jgi:hypothetical protein